MMENSAGGWLPEIGYASQFSVGDKDFRIVPCLNFSVSEVHVVAKKDIEAVCAAMTGAGIWMRCIDVPAAFGSKYEAMDGDHYKQDQKIAGSGRDE